MPEQCEEVVQLAAQGRAALPGSEQGARTRLLVDDHHARCQQREAGCQQARDHPGARHGGGYWFSFFYDPSLSSPLLAIFSNGSVHGPQAVAGEARDRAGRAHARTRAETHSAANLCDSEPHLLRSGAQLHELA